jgi:hypothetical protein
MFGIMLSLNCRIWKVRRFVFTREVIVIAQPNLDVAMDAIPMHEVDTIIEMNDSQELEGSKEESFAYVKIETTPQGYNSGRPYELRGSEKDVRQLASQISGLAKAARERAAKLSKFQKLQRRIANVFDSRSMQCFFACVIGMVSLPSANPSTPLASHLTHSSCRTSPSTSPRRSTTVT